MVILSNTHEMNFTTMTPLRCYESYVTGNRERCCQTSSQAVDCYGNKTYSASWYGEKSKQKIKHVQQTGFKPFRG